MLDSAKEGARGSAEGSDIGLGEHFQAFESHTPDKHSQAGLKSVTKQMKLMFFCHLGSVNICNP